MKDKTYLLLFIYFGFFGLGAITDFLFRGGVWGTMWFWDQN